MIPSDDGLMVTGRNHPTASRGRSRETETRKETIPNENREDL